MPVIDSVVINYLPKNVAPEVEDVTVIVGSRVPSGAHSEPESAATGAYEMPLADDQGQAFHRGEVEGARR